MHPLDWAAMATALAAGVTGSFLLRRRGSALSSRALAFVMLSGALWAVLSLLQVQTDDAAGMASLTRVVVVVAQAQAAGCAWFCLTLAGHRLTARHAGALAVQPLLIAVAAATDPWTGSVVADVALGPGGVEWGWAFWVGTAYCYALLLAGALALLRAATRAVPGHRLHYLIAVIAMSPPVLGNVVTTLGPRDVDRDLTPPLFLVTALLWLWVDRWSTRFRGSPITTAQVLRTLTDGVLVIDAAGRLVGANPPGVRLLLDRDDAQVGDLLGTHWREVADADLVKAVGDRTAGTLVRPDGTVVDLRITPVLEVGRRTGWVVVARDVTEVERLRAELSEQAVRDGLTGLHNRRHLERVLATAVEQDAVLSVAVVDIDHFKAVNDRHGHQVGDRVLVAVAQALSAGVRQGDVVARLGGEEFVLVLPGLTATQAAERVEAVRARCAQAGVPVDDGVVTATVSAGVARLRFGQDAQDLLAAADSALYAAKAAGRDRVVVAVDAPGGGTSPVPVQRWTAQGQAAAARRR